jgi:hypothetical protein
MAEYPVRRMRCEDMDPEIEWAAVEGWNPGLDDAGPFFDTDSQGFFHAARLLPGVRNDHGGSRRSEPLRLVWRRHCRTAPFMEQIGFRPLRLQAALAGLVEAGGGLLLAVGLFSPLAAAMVISVMLVATVTVHLAKGFFIQNGGCEYNLALAAGALAS